MKTTDLFPSRYVKAGDLDAGPQTVAIRELVFEEIGQGRDRETKPIIYFHDRKKALVLTKTNCSAIEDAYGDSDNWPGKSIELFSTETPFQGGLVPCVRVRVPKEASADELLSSDPVHAPIKPATKAELDEELNDEVPF
jgi:hypothetical protein